MLTFLLAFAFNFPANATSEETEYLRHVAEQYMLAQFPSDSQYKIEVKAGKLDERRSYGGHCDGYLMAEIPGSRITRSSLVRISCRDPKNTYTVTVPVTVRKLVPTVTAADNLRKQTVITPQMLREAYVDIDTNSATAVNDAGSLVGCKLKKDVKAGDQIKNGDFCMVCRGDEVNIEAVSGNLYLKTKGEALGDGNLNDQVQVRNSRSRKVVNATVTAAGTVRVLM